MPAILVLFLLNVGQLLNNNVEQMLVFLNPLVRDVGEVIDTYVYRIGLVGAQYSYSTAIGIFKSVIGLVLVVFLNQLSKKTTGETIY
jgi:putative aldouronate transport system permease protein